MQAFMAKYSGVTHALAGLWALLMTAYFGSAEFHAAVLQAGQTIYQLLPHGAAVVVTLAASILGPLWAFYRNGQKGTQASVEILPGESGTAVAKATATKTLALAFCSLLLMACVGCTGQQTAAELVAVAGTAITSLLVFEGNPADATKIQADFAAASSAVANWKNGTPASDVEEALNLVEDDLNLIAVSARDQAFISLAIGTVDQILALFPQTAVTPVATGPAMKAAFVQNGGGHVAHRKVHLKKVPKSAKEFRKLWNEEAKKQGVAPLLK